MWQVVWEIKYYPTTAENWHKHAEKENNIGTIRKTAKKPIP